MTDPTPFISQDLYLNNISLDGILISPTGGSTIPSSSGIVLSVTGTDYTYQTNNNGDTIRRSNDGVAMFDTLPEAMSDIYYPNGWVVWVENADSTADLTITPEESTINGISTLVLIPQATARIISNGSNYYAVVTSSTGVLSLVNGLATTVAADGSGVFQVNTNTGNSITLVSNNLEVNSPVNLQVVTSYTYLTTDRGKTVERDSGIAAMTDTLPQAGSAGFPAGWTTTIVNTGTTAPNVVPVTFASNITLSSVISTINNEAFIIIPAGSTCRLVSNGTNWEASVDSDYGNTANPIYNPNGVIIQPGGLTVVDQNLYGWGCAASAFSVMAQGASGNAGGVAGGFSTPSTGVSSYGSRDKVAFFASIYDQPRWIPNTFVASYTTTSVILTAPVSTSKLAVNMVIDTNDSVKYSGLITSWGSGSTTSTINVSGWYQTASSYLSAAALVSGGTGYAAGNVLTLIGGSGYSWLAEVTVNTVNGSGTILTFTVSYGGSYSSGGGLPISGVSVLTVTGGSGTGATFTGTFTSFPGNSASGQIPSGNQVDINPNTKIWSVNTSANYRGNGEASQAVGYELDINNFSGVDDNYQALWGFDSTNGGSNKIYTTYIARGTTWNAYIAGHIGVTTGSTSGFLYNSYDGAAGTGFLTYQTNGYALQCLPGNSTTLQGTSFAITANTGQIDIGSFGKSGIASSPTINFHSAAQAVSGTYNTYDAQIQVLGDSGVDGTPGRGTIMYTAANHEFMKGGGANYINIVPSLTTVAPTIAAQGTDTNISLVLKSQGNGSVVLQSSGGGTGLQVIGSSSAVVTALFVTPSATVGTDVVISTGGSNANSIRINSNGGSVKIGSGGLLATTSTTGFIMVPSVNGPPTGVPTGADAGDIPQVIDTVDGKAWWYYGGAWHYATLT